MALTANPTAVSASDELPTGCQSFNSTHDRALGSRWFLEHWSETEWKLRYPNPRLKQTNSESAGPLFDAIDIDDALADPIRAGERLMVVIDRHLCLPRPAGLGFEWQSFLQSDLGNTGHAWLSIAGQQTSDNIPVDGRYCHANYTREGELLDLQCNLVLPKTVRLPAADWLTDQEARGLAESAYLADLRNLPGPDQQTGDVTRRYSASGPVIEVQHAGCGRTIIDVSTRDAHYYCSSDQPARPQYGIGPPPDRAVIVNGLAPGFYAEQLLATGEGDAVLMLGQADQSRPATDAGHLGPASNSVLYLVAEGKVQWEWVPRPADHTWLRLQGEQALLVQLLSTDDIAKIVRTEHIDLATGRAVVAPAEFRLRHHVRMQPDSRGERLYILDERQPGALQLSYRNQQGQLSWEVTLRRRAVSDMVTTSDGGLLLLDLREVAGKDTAGLTVVSPLGEIIQAVALKDSSLGHGHLLGLRGGRAYIKRHGGYDGGKMEPDLAKVDLASGAITRAFPPLPADGDLLLEDGSVLAYGGEAEWALAAVDSGPRPWRRYFGFGGYQRFDAATPLKPDGVLLAASRSGPGQRADTPGSVALVWLFPEEHAPKRDLQDCPLVSEDALRSRELELWRRYHVFSRPELYDYTPDLDCIDRHRAEYHMFLEELLSALEAKQFRAPGFFVHLQVEPGQRGVRFKGGGLGRSQMRHGEYGYSMRAHFADAGVLADFLSEGLLPHVRTVSRMRQEFFKHVGAQLSLSYGYQAASETTAITGGHTLPGLEAMERDLSKLLQISRSLPSADYPDFAGLTGPPHLVLQVDGLVFPGAWNESHGNPQALPNLAAGGLRERMQSLEAKNWKIRQRSCNENFTGRDRWDQLLLAATCNLPGRLAEVLSDQGLPQREEEIPVTNRMPLSHRALTSPAIFDLFAAAGASPYDQDAFGQTALHAAIGAGAKALIAHFATDQRLVNLPAYNGDTALHRAALTPRYPVDLLAPLIHQANDLNAQNLDGETVLHRAVHSPDLVLALLEAGASVDAKDRGGQTPLHRAAGTWLADESIARLLEEGADPEARDAEGRTPLDVAKERRLVYNVRALQRRTNE